MHGAVKGKYIMYPSHGAMRVVNTSGAGNARSITLEEFSPLNNEPPLQITVPSKNLKKIGARFPMGKKEVDELLKILAKKNVTLVPVWTHRTKRHTAQMASDDPREIAEVARNLHLRSHTSVLPPLERGMLRKAIHLISTELSLSLRRQIENTREMVFKALDKATVKKNS